MFIKERPDPVGKPQVVESVETLLDLYMHLWDDSKNKKHFWKRFDSSRVTNFLMRAVDDFVIAVDQSNILGADKKATVLSAAERLYDYMVRETLPLWLMPFAGVLKQYVVHVLISNAIDWMVAKYKDGWKPRSMRPWEVRMPTCRRRK